MLTAYRIAGILFHVSSRPVVLPNSLEEIVSRSRLLNEINIFLLHYMNSIPTSDTLRGQILALPEPAINGMLCQIADRSRQVVAEFADDIVRTGIMLCMWAGCQDGAKIISSHTNDGENTPQKRELSCRNHVDILSNADPLYRTGVEAAPVWKRIVGQSDDIYFDGVPDNSPLLTYRNVMP